MASLSTGTIAKHILVIRDQKVLLDTDLAGLYGVTTKVLAQAVKRNADRFPDDFMVQLDDEEWESLRSQFVISNAGRGGQRYALYPFTEQGRGHVDFGTGWHAGDRSQYRDHARLRAAPRSDRVEQRIGAATGRARVSEILCVRHIMSAPKRTMYATQEERQWRR